MSFNLISDSTVVRASGATVTHPAKAARLHYLNRKLSNAAAIDWQALDGQTVTALNTDTGSRFHNPYIAAVEGTVHADVDTPHGKRTIFLLRGSDHRGLDLTDRPQALSAVVPGYGNAEHFSPLVAAELAKVPELDRLTRDDFLALPDYDGEGEPPATIGLGVMLTHRFPFMPAQTCPGTLWLFTDYDRENDILNGYMRVADEDQGIADSEHGSIYGRDLLNRRYCGKLRNLPQGGTFREVLGAGKLSDFDAFARWGGAFDLTSTV